MPFNIIYYVFFFDIPLIWAYHHLSVFMYDLNMIILYIICSTPQDMVLLKMTMSKQYFRHSLNMTNILHNERYKLLPLLHGLIIIQYVV